MHDYIIVLTISTYDFLLSFLVFLLFCTIFSYFLIYFLSIYHIIMLIFHCGELVIFYKTVFYAQKNQLDDSWFLSYLQNYIHVDISLRFILPAILGQALTRLVTVSSMCCHTSTSALSTSSSSRGFTS